MHPFLRSTYGNCLDNLSQITLRHRDCRCTDTVCIRNLVRRTLIPEGHIWPLGFHFVGVLSGCASAVWAP